jgi:hypothetical protein
MMFGLTPPDCEIALKPFDVFRRELHLTASFINPTPCSALVEPDRKWRDPDRTTVWPPRPLKDIATVFEDPAYRKLGKILIIP